MRRSPALALAVAGLTLLASCSARRDVAGAGAGGEQAAVERAGGAAAPLDSGSAASQAGTTGASASGLAGSGPGASALPFERFETCEAMVAWTKDRLLEQVSPWGLTPGFVIEDHFAPDGEAWAATVPAMDEATPVIVGEVAEAPAATEAPAAQEAAADVTEAPAASAGDVGRAENTSGTNTQDVGVDEGDIAETDGRYVYSIVDSTLRSVDLDTSTLLAEVPLPTGRGYEMLLDGESLLLVTTEYGSFGNRPDTVIERYAVPAGLPQLITTTHLEGHHLSTRAVDGQAMIVMTTPFTDRLVWGQPGSNSKQSWLRAIEYNRSVIAGLDSTDILPRTFDRPGNQPAAGSSGDLRPALDCADVGHPGEFSGLGFTWVATIDLRQPNALSEGRAGVIADGSIVYASARNPVRRHPSRHRPARRCDPRRRPP